MYMHLIIKFQNLESKTDRSEIDKYKKNFSLSINDKIKLKISVKSKNAVENICVFSENKASAWTG